MIGFPPDNAPRLIPGDASAWYEDRISLPRPDWAKVRGWIEALPKNQHDLAWCQAACDWLKRLGAALGPQYVLHESPVFLALVPGSDEIAGPVLGILEKEWRRVRRMLGEATYDDYLGKATVIVIEGVNSYYNYIADFYPPQGQFATSGAIFLYHGYGHIVTPLTDIGRLHNSLSHETVHYCLFHRRLPRWLDEGLAVVLSEQPGYSFADCWMLSIGSDSRKAFADWRRRLDSQTIQKFWSGESFKTPGESTFSYVLAAELTRRLTRQRRFKEFLLRASKHDAGVSAATDVLRLDLGKEMVALLGDGDWRPRSEATSSAGGEDGEQT